MSATTALDARIAAAAELVDSGVLRGRPNTNVVLPGPTLAEGLAAVVAGQAGRAS